MRMQKETALTTTLKYRGLMGCTLLYTTKEQCECNSAVEYLVANENVEGSNPFVRSFPFIGITVKPAW